MDNASVEKQMRDLAEAVRRACAEAAEGAYEDAGIRGLCAEGRWEGALDAIRHLDLEQVIRDVLVSCADRHESAMNDGCKG